MDNIEVGGEEKTRFLDNAETDIASTTASATPDTRSWNRWILNTCFYLIITTLAFGIVASAVKIQARSFIRPSPETALDMTPEEAHPCGFDANTARDRGCNFDPLTFAWLPPACYDYNLTAEFLQLQDWAWWRERADGSRRQLSLINVMQSSDDVLFVSWEYHRQHCVYLWLKMHRAMLAGVAIDGVSMLDIITDVCDGVLRSERDVDDTSVPGYIRYPSCKVY